MTKVELEAKLVELETRIKVLEARPFCLGHVVQPQNPNFPVYPMQPFYTITY